MKRIIGILKTQTIKDSFVVALGLGGSAVIGFIYTIILARSLGPGSFGIYSALTALGAIVYSIGDMGISSAIINFLPKKLSERYKYLATSFWMQFSIAVFVFLLFIVFSVYRNYLVPGSLPEDMLLIGALSFNNLFILYTQGVFTAQRKFWSYTASQLADSVTKIIIVFAIYKMGNLSVTSAIGANVVSTFIALLVTFGKELYGIEFDFFRDAFKNIVNFAKWIAVSRVFTVLISRIDIVLLNILASSYSAGIYSAASRVTIFFAMIAAGLNSVISPRFSSFDNHHKTVSYTKKLLLLVTGVAAVMVFISLFASPIILLVYGDTYTQSISVFRYLILAMIPFLYTIISNAALIYAFNQLNFYTYMVAVQTVIIVGLDLFLIPRLDFLAPVIALLASNIFVFFASFIKLRTHLYAKRTMDRG